MTKAAPSVRPVTRKFVQSDNMAITGFDGTGLSGGVDNYAFVSNALNTKKFGFHGINPANLVQRNNVFPQYNQAQSVNAAFTEFETCFYHTGPVLDIIKYGDAAGFSLFVDDEYFGSFSPAVQTGTAQAGSSNSITLAASNSTSLATGYFNETYVRITGGAGVLNEVRQITAYNPSTRVATVDTNWTTAPDSTTTYAIQTNDAPFVLEGLTGSVRYMHLASTKRARRKISIWSSGFYGVRVGANDVIQPASGDGKTQLFIVSDSFFEGSNGPDNNQPRLSISFARELGLQLVNLSSGGTGAVIPKTGSTATTNRLNFKDRIAPPTEAWAVRFGGTAGTFTASVTLGGSTQTTGALAYNISNTALETALNALSNVAAAGGDFAIARGDAGAPRYIVAHNMAGATISFDTSGLTGTITNLGQWMGDVAANIQYDGAGNPLPFILGVGGSGNDFTATDAEVQAAYTYIAQQIVARFPSAIPVFWGVVGDAGTGTSGVIASGDLSRNAAIQVAAQLLPKIKGSAPFIDTYEEGLGGNKILYGTGSVGAPVSGTTAIFKSLMNPGHPTGYGMTHLAMWMARRFIKLFD